MNIFRITILGNTLAQWLLAIVVGLFVYAVLRVLFWLLRKRLNKDIQQHPVGIAILIKNLLDHTMGFFFTWLAIFTGTRSLTLSPTVLAVIETITAILILIQLGLWSIELIEFWLIHRQLARGGQVVEKKGPMAAISLLTKIVVWTLVIILILENIPGVHVTTLIASLGIGGIAIGLALQKILGDLFASLTISIDQPFVEGDAIAVDDLSGAVEHVGLKSTRVRSSTGEQLVFSNSDLLESRIHNFKRMEKRMVVFTLNITYQTSHKKLQKIPKIIKEIVDAQSTASFGRAHFKAFSDSALVYEVVYSMNTYDFNIYMDTLQEINLEIYRQFDEEGIQFAYPTQTVFVNK